MELNTKEINNLTKGIIPARIEGKPFVVMRQWEKIILNDSGNWSWNILLSPEDKDCTQIEREQASKIIDAFDMKKTHSESCGSIYEMPGSPFLEQFNRRKAWEN